jgi:hypothetical protein
MHTFLLNDFLLQFAIEVLSLFECPGPGEISWVRHGVEVPVNQQHKPTRVSCILVIFTCNSLFHPASN